MGNPTIKLSFGEWVRQRRQHLDMTQATLAYRVGCAAITIRKIESDERRPSRQMAARLAASLAIGDAEIARFVAIALGELPMERLRVDPASRPDPATPEPPANAQPTPPTDEIRVVTVVAAGIGHAAESASRPDASAEWIARLRTLLHTLFAGQEVRLEQSLDGRMVAAFGAHHHHEDDAERALQAALQLHDAAQRLRLPIAIGIHGGPAYLSHVTDSGALLGATVSLALRLQDRAGDGQILVSQKVYRQTRLAFDFAPFTALANGEAMPAAHLLLRARRHQAKARGIEGHQPILVGRQAELAKLEQLVGALVSSQTNGDGSGDKSGEGNLVILAGEAGVGKSRLLAHLKAQVFGEGATIPNLLWLEGRCLETTMSTGYGPFLDLLRSYFAWEPEADGGRRGEEVRARLQELVSAACLSASQSEKIGPLIANLFAFQAGNHWDEQLRHMRPEEIKQQSFLALYDLLVALARRQPLLLVFEDLHWADGVSLDLLAHLMEALPTIPLLLIAVCRPEQAHRSNQLATVALRKCPGHLTEITLRELPPRYSRQLLHAYLGEEVPEAVAQVILTRAQGNPFFIEEMVHTLISLDLLYQVQHRWLARPHFDAAIVPDSIQSLLLSRVDRLSPIHKSILHYAAVIGRHFSRQLLAVTLSAHQAAQRGDHSNVQDSVHTADPRGDDDLTWHLWQLETQAFLYQERTIPEAIYSFRHILTHEAIYATIPQQRAAVLHGAVAAALESSVGGELAERYEQLAYHYERSLEQQKAVDYLLKAAQKARRAYLNEEAIGYFGRALARLEQLPSGAQEQELRLAALIELGQSYYHGTSQLDLAENVFRQALALAQSMQLPPRRVARIHIWLGDILMNWQPRFDESLRQGHAALALLGDDLECNEGALANTLISLSHLMVGNAEDAIEYALRNTPFAAQLPCEDELDHLVYLAISCAYIAYRQPGEIHRWLMLSLRNAEANNHLHALGEASTCLAVLAAGQGDLRAAAAQSHKALAILLRSGDPKRYNWCLMGLLWYCLQLGELPTIHSLGAQVLAQAQLVNQEYLHDLHFCLGLAALAEAAWQTAADHFHQAAQQSESASPAWAESQIALGYTELARDHPLAAADLFQAVAASALDLPDFALRRTRGPYEYNSPLADALTALEAALDDEEVIRRFYAGLQATKGQAHSSKFVQWHLARVQIDSSLQREVATATPTDEDLQAAFIATGWQWQDSLGDCAIAFDSGVTLHADNGRDLWGINNSAPRLTRCLEGDFALQVVCAAPSGERPAQGGLLLWRDLSNFVRLDWGSRGVGEVTLLGSFNRQDAIIGRGKLHATQPYLRLERKGEQVRALCSPDGHAWYTVGEVEFSSSSPLEVGIYASGVIDPRFYPGRSPNGSAIHFSAMRLWLDGEEPEAT